MVSVTACNWIWRLILEIKEDMGLQVKGSFDNEHFKMIPVACAIS